MDVDLVAALDLLSIRCRVTLLQGLEFGLVSRFREVFPVDSEDKVVFIPKN